MTVLWVWGHDSKNFVSFCFSGASVCVWVCVSAIFDAHARSVNLFKPIKGLHNVFKYDINITSISTAALKMEKLKRVGHMKFCCLIFVKLSLF